MAMNKKEQAVVEDLKLKLALRYTESVEKDIPIPTYGSCVDNKLILGYSMNSYSKEVTPSCSSVTGHNTCGTDRTRSQFAIAQYSTRLLAYKAMRNEVEKRCAKELREIDRLIEKEIENG